jgi:hypothetical protein
MMTAAQPITDVWDARTFDSALFVQLEANADLISAYFETDHQIFLSHALGRGPVRSILRPENPNAPEMDCWKRSAYRWRRSARSTTHA